MEENKQSPIMNGLIYGLMTGGVIIVFSLIMFLLNQHMNKALTWISYLFLLGGMILGTLQYRKKVEGNYLTYGQAFASCFWIGLFAGLLATIYMFIFVNYIHPGFIQELMEQQREAMLQSKPDLSEEQLDTAMAFASKFTSPVMMVIFGLVGYAVVSAILSLIAAIFLKKDKQEVSF